MRYERTQAQATVLVMFAVFESLVLAVMIITGVEWPILLAVAAFMGFIALLAEFLLGSLAWWTIAVANIMATAGMGYYLWRMHPKLRAAFAENPLDKTY